MKVKVGDELWFAPDSTRRLAQPGIKTVTKVGRIWAYVGTHGDRFSIETMRADNINGQGTYYRSREESEISARADAVWTLLRRSIDCFYSRPRAIDAAAIHQAAELLGFTLTPDAPK